MLKLQLTNFANFKKLWFVSASHKSTRLYLTEYMTHTYEPNYTKSRDHALVMYRQIIPLL